MDWLKSDGRFPPDGFPHSDTHGSKLDCSSPWHFAAYRVLHRHCAPRHPPRALCSLTPKETKQNSSRTTSPLHKGENRHLLDDSRNRSPKGATSKLSYLLYSNKGNCICVHAIPTTPALCLPKVVATKWQKQSSKYVNHMQLSKYKQRNLEFRVRLTGFLETAVLL